MHSEGPRLPFERRPKPWIRPTSDAVAIDLCVPTHVARQLDGTT
jgi:hypothetical protein